MSQEKNNNIEDLQDQIYKKAFQQGTLQGKEIGKISIWMNLEPGADPQQREFIPGLWLLVGSANAGKTYFYSHIIDPAKNAGTPIIMDEPVPGAIFSPDDMTEWYSFVLNAQQAKTNIIVVDSFSGLLRKRLESTEDALSSGIAGHLRQRLSMLSSRLAAASKIMFACVNTDDLGKGFDIAQFLEGGVEGIVRLAADRAHEGSATYSAVETHRTFIERAVLGKKGIVEGERPTTKLYEYTVSATPDTQPDEEDWF
jgi:hypothetical protein